MRGKDTTMTTMKTLTEAQLKRLSKPELIALIETLTGKAMPDSLKSAGKTDMINAVLFTYKKLQTAESANTTTKEDTTMTKKNTTKTKPAVKTETKPAVKTEPEKATPVATEAAPDSLYSRITWGVKKYSERKKAVFGMTKSATRRVWEVYRVRGGLFDVYINDTDVSENLLEFEEFLGKHDYKPEFSMKNRWRNCTWAEVVALIASIA